MNCFIRLSAIKPMLAATVANCGRTDANRRVCLFLTKPYANYYHFVSKSRLRGSTSAPVKQIVAVSKRAVSNNTSPVPSYKKHDHSSAWVWERIIAVSLLGAFPYFATQPTAVAEMTLTFVVTVHAHRGLEAICTDYLRPAVVGNFIPKCIPIIVAIPIMFTAYGIVNSILSERGLHHVLRQFWELKTTEQLKGERKANV